MTEQMLFDDADEVLTALASNAGPAGVEVAPETLVMEWGVRYPSGAVQVHEGEAEARRFSLNVNGLRPDLPTIVVRKIVTNWTEPDDV